MGVFHDFWIVQMVPSGAKHHKYKMLQIQIQTQFSVNLISHIWFRPKIDIERIYLWLGVMFSIILSSVKLESLLKVQRTREKFSYNGGNNFMKHWNILVQV